MERPSISEMLDYVQKKTGITSKTYSSEQEEIEHGVNLVEKRTTFESEAEEDVELESLRVSEEEAKANH